QRKLRFLRTRARELRMIGKALLSTKHPVLVHIIPMRRCNLDCGYCNEYDQVSKPVPLEEMKRRLDYLAAMGTSIITISGGEPLMHPELEEVIRHIRKRGMIAGMITNGFLLSVDRIKSLNAVGLEHLQISIEIMTLGKRSFSRFNEFQHNVARGREHNWRCRSGARYLYICEDGLVHWCSQQRGYPGIPLAKYTPEMRQREYLTDKFCGPRCTVSCVQQIGILDNWRDPQNL